MNDRIVANIILVGASLVLAVFLGSWVISAPKEVGVGIAVVLAIVVFMVLNRNVWILIPACMTLGIRFPLIPGGFSTVELASMFVVGCTFFLLLNRRVSLRLKMTSLEWMSIAILLLLIQSFLRNPVGIRALGSANVGGRPYVIIIITVCAGIVLASTRTDHAQIKRAFRWSIYGYLVTFVIQVLAYASAKIAFYTTILFGVTGGHSATDQTVSVNSGRASRNTLGSFLASSTSRTLVAFKSPLKALFHPLWLILLVVSIVSAGVSGYRSVIGVTGITLLLGIYYWGGGRAVVLAGFLGISGYMGINILNMAIPLPPNIQRSLSFLPGSWEDRYKEDANASTDWRVEMWKEALLTDTYIRNKYLGDGLGIQRSDFLHMKAIGESRIITDEMSQERAMLAGDFHSGPVTTIKVIGYVGLIILTIAMVVVALRAHRLIMNSRNKPHFKEVLFFCLPLVYMPIVFLFVFGSFKSSIPVWFIQVGLLRLLERNLNENEAYVDHA